MLINLCAMRFGRYTRSSPVILTHYRCSVAVSVPISIRQLSRRMNHINNSIGLVTGHQYTFRCIHLFARSAVPSRSRPNGRPCENSAANHTFGSFACWTHHRTHAPAEQSKMYVRKYGQSSRRAAPSESKGILCFAEKDSFHIIFFSVCCMHQNVNAVQTNNSVGTGDVRVERKP